MRAHTRPHGAWFPPPRRRAPNARRTRAAAAPPTPPPPSSLDLLRGAVPLQPPHDADDTPAPDPALVARGRALWADPATLAAAAPASAPLRVALLLSGGVDSSVALRLLQAAGHDVTAFYLKIWFEDDFRNAWSACPWSADLAACAAVAAAAGVPLRVVPLTRAYWDGVVAECVAELRAGRTPNPDVLCNSRVKFGAFIDALAGATATIETVDGDVVANELTPGHPLGGFDRVASGHYADAVRAPDPRAPAAAAADPAWAALAPAADPVKDQTYFLARLTPRQLAHALFPLAPLVKGDVRALAAAARLPNAARPDSQGVCFLGKVRFDEFVGAHLGSWPGPLIDADDGRVVGYHDGPWFFTPGQRRGVRLPGGPWYVTAKDMDTNAVYVSRRYHEEEGGGGGDEGGEEDDGGHTASSLASPRRPRDRFRVASLAWLPGGPPRPDAPLTVKVRHGPHAWPCELTLDAAPPGGGGATAGAVRLAGRDQGLAAGQWAVFYQGGLCVGSGVIE